MIVWRERGLREAAKGDLPVAREVALCAIHGTLHRMGLDDLDPARRREMKRRGRHYVELYRALGGE